MDACRYMMLITMFLVGCDGADQQESDVESSFIDLSEGEVPEFRTAVEEARASVEELEQLIERKPESQI